VRERLEKLAILHIAKSMHLYLQAVVELHFLSEKLTIGLPTSDS